MRRVMGIFTQCRDAVGSILNKYLVPRLLSPLRPPRRIPIAGRTQAIVMSTVSVDPGQ